MMSKKIFRGLLCLILVLMVAGCGVRAKRYVQIRERVDQQPAGNAGYFTGAPKPEDQTQMKTTRKVYVLEFTKESKVEEEEVEMDFPPISTYNPPRRNQPAQRISIPDFDRTAPSPTSEPSVVEYKVEKDDTLQKISKKFYDRYSKWPRIYEANKQRIKNPNFLKPGTVLQIPMD